MPAATATSSVEMPSVPRLSNCGRGVQDGKPRVISSLTSARPATNASRHSSQQPAHRQANRSGRSRVARVHRGLDRTPYLAMSVRMIRVRRLARRSNGEQREGVAHQISEGVHSVGNQRSGGAQETRAKLRRRQPNVGRCTCTRHKLCFRHQSSVQVGLDRLVRRLGRQAASRFAAKQRPGRPHAQVGTTEEHVPYALPSHRMELIPSSKVACMPHEHPLTARSLTYAGQRLKLMAVLAAFMLVVSIAAAAPLACDGTSGSDGSCSALPTMQYRRLGRTGLRVSVLSFGAWLTFGRQLGDEV